MDSKTKKSPVKEAEPEPLEDLSTMEVEMLAPAMTVNNDMVPQAPPCPVKDEQLLGLYDEILQMCRQDRQDCQETMSNFADMIFNDGDASSASKEALVNLYKIRSDIADKMGKVADLMTRVKLKERDTFPRYLAASTVHIESSKSTREFLKKVERMQKEKSLTNGSK